MPRPAPFPLLVLVLATACKDDKPPPAAEPTEEQKREQQCDRFATDMARTVGLTGQILVTALDDEPGGVSARQDRAEIGAEARKLRDELKTKCMGWPPEVMECLPPLGVLKDGCEERLIAALDGAAPMPRDLPPGPEPAWTFRLDGVPRALGVTDDGTVVVIAGVESDDLLGLRDGGVAWRREGQHRPWWVPLAAAPGVWVVGEEHQLIAVDARTGSERWTASLPPADPEFDEAARVMTAAVDGDGLLVGDAEARFFRVDPAACATGGAGCVAPDGALEGEHLDSDARLLVQGTQRYLWEDDTLRAFAPGWRRLMTARAHDDLSHAHLHAKGLRLLVDEDVVALDPTQCRGDEPFAPSGWPQPGALVFRDSDECPECSPPPAGCRTWRAHVPDAGGSTPAVLADGAVVLHDDGHTLAVDGGTVRWKVATAGFGPLATDGRRVFGVSAGREMDDPPAVLELDGRDGSVAWSRPLPSIDGDSLYGDEIHVAVAGPWLAVGLDQHVVVLRTPGG